jgi:predicted aspartyl protease
VCCDLTALTITDVTGPRSSADGWHSGWPGQGNSSAIDCAEIAENTDDRNPLAARALSLKLIKLADRISDVRRAQSARRSTGRNSGAGLHRILHRSRRQAAGHITRFWKSNSTRREMALKRTTSTVIKPLETAPRLYGQGRGVTQDDAEAAEWYRKSADQGNALAQYGLGLLYYNGSGVSQNYVLAHMWFNLVAAAGPDSLAAEGRVTFGAKYRDIVSEKMNAAQIAEAQKLAREWRPKVANAAPTKASQGGVPLKMDGGIFVVPVQINGAMTLDFVIDSGAADVSVPADVVSTLMRAGAIKETDFIGRQTYVLADGSKSQSVTFTIRSLRVGDMENVRGSVASSQGSLLLGQSFLERFKSWSIDNTKHELLLEPR